MAFLLFSLLIHPRSFRQVFFRRLRRKLIRGRWLVVLLAIQFCGMALHAADVQSVWNAGTGAWDNAGNWSNLPAAAQFPANGNGGFTYDATLDNGGTITLNSDVTIQKFSLTAGTVTGAANLTALETFVWKTGTLSGSGVMNASGGATIDLDANGATLSQRSLNLGAGKTSTWSGTGDLFLGSGAVITNNGTFNIQNDRAITFNTIGAQPALNNNGTLTKSAGSGATVIGVTFNNTGTVDVQSGTLNFTRGGSSSGAIGGAATVGFAAGTGTMNLTGTYGVGTTVVSAGTVNFNTSAAATTGALSLNGGVLSGSATLNVTGPMSWTGGTMSGAGVTNIGGDATINVATASFGISQRTLNLAAGHTTSWSGAGNMFLSGAAINNNGTFDIQADRSMLPSGIAQSTFNNAGTLKKSGGSGTAVIAVALNNTGVVDAQSGVLRFSGGGVSSGSMIGAGAIGFGGETMTISGSYQLSGETIISAGVTNFNTSTAATTGKLTLNGGVLSGSAAVNVNQLLTWTGGSMTGANVINALGGMSIQFTGSGGGLSQRTLNLAAGHTVTWSGTGDLFLDTGAKIQNAGIFDIQGNQSIFVDIFADSSFTNTGILTKSAGAGDSNIAAAFTSSGEIHPESGFLKFFGGGSSTGSIAGAGSIGFSDGTMNISGTYAVGGQTLIDGGSVNFDTSTAASSGSLRVASGTFAGSAAFNVAGATIWEGGGISGSNALNANGGISIHFEGIGNGLSQRTLNLAAGAMSSWSGTGDLFLDTGAAINNHGTLELQNDQTIFQVGSAQSSFTNTGTLVKTIGTGTSTIGVTFSNTGTVDVQSGTLTVNASVAQASGTTLNGGTWIVRSQSTLSLPTVGNIVTNLGDVRLLGTGSVFSNIDTLANNKGAFRLSSGRVFTTAGAFTNSGVVALDGPGTKFIVAGAYTQTAGTTDLGASGTTFAATSISINGGSLTGSGTIDVPTTVAGVFAPGHSAGAMTVAGNFTLTSSAQSFFQIGGTVPGAGYDLLAQTAGTLLSIGGTLDVVLIDGFQDAITPEDTFGIIVANNGLTGAFSNAADGQRLNTGDGRGSFLVNYTASGVILSDFAAVPEPSTFALLGAAAAILLFGLRRSARNASRELPKNPC